MPKEPVDNDRLAGWLKGRLNETVRYHEGNVMGGNTDPSLEQARSRTGLPDDPASSGNPVRHTTPFKNLTNGK